MASLCRNGHLRDENNTKVLPSGYPVCRVCQRASIARWEKAHPEKKKAKDTKRRERGYFKAYNQKNKAQHREYHKEYYQKNKERITARIAKYEEANKEKLTASRKAWRTPEKQRIANHKRKARRLAALGSHTESELMELLQKQNNCCANPYCNTLLLGGFRKTIDHIVPISRGGSNDIKNLQWLCRHCNTSKGIKSMDEWLERQAA